MKKVFEYSILVIAMILLTSCGAAKNKMTAKSDTKALDELMASNEFQFEVDWVRPLMTTAVNSVMLNGLTPPGSTVNQINVMGGSYFIKIEKDSIMANLPYYGERQMSGGYNTRNGIEFAAPPGDLEIIKDDSKSRYQVNFNISEETENFRVRMTVFENLTANVIIYSSHRTSIRYSGKVSEIGEDDLQ